MEMSVITFLRWWLWDWPLILEKHVYSSKQGRTVMGILTLKIYFSRWKMWSIFLKEKPMGLWLVFSCLTMLQAIRNAQKMPFQHVKCPKTHAQHGGTTKIDQKCDSRILRAVTCPRTSNLLKTIWQCPNGLKGWRISYANRGFGLRKDWMCNVKGLNARWGGQSAVVISCYSHSLTLWTRNLTWKYWSHLKATFVIFTPSTIASSISLSRTGEHQSWGIEQHRRQTTWNRWKGIWAWWHATCSDSTVSFFSSEISGCCI